MRIIIVGAGVVGVTSAWFLAREGHAVTVLDRAQAVAEGTSHANAGMLTPSMADPWNSPGVFWQMLKWLGREDAPLLLRPHVLPSLLDWGLAFIANSRPKRFKDNTERNLQLATYSLRVLEDLREQLPLAYDERSAGTLKVFRDMRDFDESKRRCEMLAPLGLNFQTLDGTGITGIEPSLAPVQADLVGGIYFPDDESGDARQFTEALAAQAQTAGVEFRFGVEVTGFERQGARVSGVISNQECLAADAVIVAAGSWSPVLLRKLGLRLPIRPVKGYSVTLAVGEWDGAPARPVIDEGLHAAVTPLGGRLRVAGTAEFAGYDTRPTQARIDNLFQLLLAMFPSYEPHLDRDHAAPWAGLRPVSADGVPFIGQFGPENLYVNTGHGHLGWTLAAGSSRLLTDLIQHRSPVLDPLAYRPQRGCGPLG